jgi:hypothetical protein
LQYLEKRLVLERLVGLALRTIRGFALSRSSTTIKMVQEVRLCFGNSLGWLWRQWKRIASSAFSSVFLLSWLATPQGLFKWHQYQVVGRHNPTDAEPNPTVYRMKVWASDAVRAKSKFW